MEYVIHIFVIILHILKYTYMVYLAIQRYHCEIQYIHNRNFSNDVLTIIREYV